MSHVSPAPPQRFAGDGYDYRRPVMSTDRIQHAARTPTPRPDIIDLTNDSDHSRPIPRRRSIERSVPRLQQSTRRQHDPPRQRRRNGRPATDMPALGPAIIDLETTALAPLTAPPDAPLSNDELSNDEFLAYFQEPPSSPGFEILGERSVGHEPAGRRSVAERRPTPYVNEGAAEPLQRPSLPQRLYQQLPHGLSSWFGLTDSHIDGGDTAGIREYRMSQNGSVNRYTYSNGAYTPNTQYHTGSSWLTQQRPLQLPRIPALDDFQRPRLNYEAQGFELIGATPSSPPPLHSSPYKAPRAPAPGFTRKVEEDDIVVCPHCGDELGTGSDDVKQQIWVVKQCGHVSSRRLIFVWHGPNRVGVQVYCGDCAMNRHVGKSKKMAVQVDGKPEPFKTCVVEDCKKPVTSKAAFFQVYL
jgi:hypothetical protein